jgi:hypothetical protein
MSQLVLKKENAKQRIVFAEVYAPNRPDSDGEFMDEETIRKMAYGFMREMKLDQIDHQHTNELVDDARVVESFLARKGDPDFIEGSWVVGIHIPRDEDWEKVEKGEWNGFSIEAIVSKEVVDVELEIPPILSGKTIKSGGHDHIFHVAYDDNGKFLGGKTDTIDGHFHVIKRGTVTEEANGHTHRFSHLENLSLQEK